MVQWGGGGPVRWYSEGWGVPVGWYSDGGGEEQAAVCLQ